MGFILPCPSKSRAISARELLGDVESQTSGALYGGTSASKHLDDLEDAVGSGLLVKGDGQLAGATFVDGRAVEVEENSFVHRDFVHRSDLVRRFLAGVVGSAGLQRGGVQIGDVEWHWESHFHVGVGEAAKGCGEYGANREGVCHVRNGVGGGGGSDRGVGVEVPKRLDLLVGGFDAAKVLCERKRQMWSR